MEKCTCHKKVRSDDEKKKLTNRLNRIEGQIRGIKKMLEDDNYCIDILTQVSAVNSALKSFSNEIITEHIKSCVVNDIKDGSFEKTDELLLVLKKLIK